MAAIDPFCSPFSASPLNSASSVKRKRAGSEDPSSVKSPSPLSLPKKMQSEAENLINSPSPSFVAPPDQKRRRTKSPGPTSPLQTKAVELIAARIAARIQGVFALSETCLADEPMSTAPPSPHPSFMFRYFSPPKQVPLGVGAIVISSIGHKENGSQSSSGKSPETRSPGSFHK